MNRQCKRSDYISVVYKIPQEEERLLRHFEAMQIHTNFDLPKPLALAAAKKAQREKRRIVVAKDSEGELRFMSVGEWTRRLHDVDRLCEVKPSGVFSD